MKLILITFGFFIIIIAGMALGYIFKRQAIKGSCGGISALGMEKVCDCDRPCDNLKKKVETGEVSAEALERFNQTPQFYEVK